MLSRCLSVAFLFSLCFILGCGGGSNSAPPQNTSIQISVSPASASVVAGGIQPFFASVTGTNNTAVTWQVNGKQGGDATIGTIDAAGNYTAPAIIPSPATVTVTAVLTSNTKKSGSASVTIALGITPFSASLHISDLTCSSTIPFTATGSNAGYNWLVNGIPSGDSIFGTIDGNGLYTAPGAIPQNPVFTVSAQSAGDPTQVGTASMTLDAGGPGVNETFLTPPVQLGTSGGNVNDSSSGFCCSGTLGALVSRAGVNYILSNNHVLARSGNAKPGEHISQPGMVDTRCGTNSNSIVANFTQAVQLNKGGTSIADAAIAQVVSGQVDPTGAILQLGTVSCGLAQPAPPANTTGVPSPGMNVAKSGRTTGLTCSQISAVNVAVAVDYENSCGSNSTFTVNYDNQIDILSTTFSAPGDSGSLIVDSSTAQPVGLLYAGSDSDTVANPIADVLGALKDSKGNAPTFVGGPTHPVEACAGTGASNAVAQASNAQSVMRLSDEEIERATITKRTHVESLMKTQGVIGVGVGMSDQPNKAAIVVILERDKAHGVIPKQIDGIPTKTRTSKRFKALMGSCPASYAAGPRWSLPVNLR